MITIPGIEATNRFVVVPKGQHVKEAEKIALKIAAFDPDAVRSAKEAVSRGIIM